MKKAHIYSLLKRYKFCRGSHLALLIPYAGQEVLHHV